EPFPRRRHQVHPGPRPIHADAVLLIRPAHLFHRLGIEPVLVVPHRRKPPRVRRIAQRPRPRLGDRRQKPEPPRRPFLIVPPSLLRCRPDIRVTYVIASGRSPPWPEAQTSTSGSSAPRCCPSASAIARLSFSAARKSAMSDSRRFTARASELAFAVAALAILSF